MSAPIIPTDATDEVEAYGPPAPLRLFTYRYYHPGYRQWQTLDCAAVTIDGALASAVRFIRREHRRLKKYGLGLQFPAHVNCMKREG